MVRIAKTLSVACLVVLSGPAHTEFAWYFGKVSRIYLHADGFVLTLDSNALDDCLYKYVHYRDSGRLRMRIPGKFAVFASGCVLTDTAL